MPYRLRRHLLFCLQMILIIYVSWFTMLIHLRSNTTFINNERVCYRIHDVIDNLDQVIMIFVLFVHAFTDCDSTSAIHNFRKQSIFSKLVASNNLRWIAQQFFFDNHSPERIGNASICFFEELYSPGSSL